MPLSGYLKTSDPGRISTIAIAGSKERRKKILPTRYNSKTAAETVYMRDCVTHGSPESMGGTVPVEMFRNEGKEWISLGIARCCVLCWLVIVPPTNDFPEPQPLPVGKGAAADGGSPRRRGPDKQPRTRAESKTMQSAAKDLKGWLDADPSMPMSVAELMAGTGLPRASMNRLLDKMVEKGYLVREEEESASGRKRWMYYSSKKEA